jgi:mRNA-degrading endonuclease toxin of MazEF toxin-antitoxin module
MFIQPGDILLVREVPDPQGKNPKERPCLVIQEVEDIFYGVAITSSFMEGESNRVTLPWSRPVHPRTGLHKRCAAACDWVLMIRWQDIVEKIGYCPGK